MCGLAAFEKRWPIGTKQRTAYSLMLNMGTAGVDTHALTWTQVDGGACYRRHKIDVLVDMAVSEDLRKVLEQMPREHEWVIVTAFGNPFTVDGFSGWMRDAIRARTATGTPAPRPAQDAGSAPGRCRLFRPRHHGGAWPQDPGRGRTLHPRS